jgi:hypothetical protein
MSGIDYTLLVDETGVDGTSKRVMYVGCLFETSELEGVETAILAFNQRCLDDPLYSGHTGLVNASDEPRHFVDDSESLRVRFIDEVVRSLPFRVYAIFDTPKATVRASKVDLFKAFIDHVRQVREIGTLKVIIERSGADDKHLEQCGAEFKPKEYLALGIADYYGAILHRFHEKRLELIANGNALRRRELNSLAINHYSVLVDRVSLERDLSTGEKSSRKDGRYFLQQIHDMVSSD